MDADRSWTNGMVELGYHTRTTFNVDDCLFGVSVVTNSSLSRLVSGLTIFAKIGIMVFENTNW